MQHWGSVMFSYGKTIGIILCLVLLALIQSEVSSHAADGICCLSAPSDLEVINRSDQSITLSWQDNSRGEDGFIIERCSYVNCSIESSHFGEFDQVPENTTIYKDHDVYYNIIYHYRVRAYNRYETSGYSNAVSTTPLSSNVNINCMITSIMPLNSDSANPIWLIIGAGALLAILWRFRHYFPG